MVTPNNYMRMVEIVEMINTRSIYKFDRVDISNYIASYYFPRGEMMISGGVKLWRREDVEEWCDIWLEFCELNKKRNLMKEEILQSMVEKKGRKMIKPGGG